MRFQSALRRGTAGVAVAVSLLLAGSGCSLLDSGDAEASADDAPSQAAVVENLVDSQFTRDGTFQSHLGVNGAPDFVFTIYPTKSTPRTNEWYPAGKKFFSFTFQAYDLARRLRDPFSTKRLVYLDQISVTSRTITVDGGATERPYRLDAKAADITFDPEPLTSRRFGMLITSPKGAFELRNQAIKPTSPDTRGIELTFSAVVHVQTQPGSKKYVKRTVRQTVPIAIFESDEATEVAPIPVNAN
jgi:hypothetical protein